MPLTTVAARQRDRSLSEAPVAHGHTLGPWVLGKWGIMLVCVTTAASCLWNAASPVGKSQHPRWRHGVLLGSATLLLVIWIVNPMGNLDNRFSGWLSGATVLPVGWRLPAAAARPARVVFLPASLSPTSERQDVHE
ncbi:MAG: hypothetical protein QOG86_254 [Thermoleophilaceae bacterium]|nr:hypothetical protein [Thermoleophilaceae bacterium]